MKGGQVTIFIIIGLIIVAGIITIFLFLGQTKIEETREKNTAGSTNKTETAKETPGKGVIKALAEDADEKVAVGDRIIYKQYSGTNGTFNNEDFIFVQVGDILAKYVELEEI